MAAAAHAPRSHRSAAAPDPRRRGSPLHSLLPLPDGATQDEVQKTTVPIFLSPVNQPSRPEDEQAQRPPAGGIDAQLACPSRQRPVRRAKRVARLCCRSLAYSFIDCFASPHPWPATSSLPRWRCWPLRRARRRRASPPLPACECAHSSWLGGIALHQAAASNAEQSSGGLRHRRLPRRPSPRTTPLRLPLLLPAGRMASCWPW